VFVQISKSICQNCKMYLFKFQNVFVQIAKCICSNFKKYLSKFQNVFIQITQGICQNSKMLAAHTFHQIQLLIQIQLMNYEILKGLSITALSTKMKG